MMIFTQEMQLLFLKKTQILSYYLSENEMKQDYQADPKVLEGMLVKDLWGNERGVSHASISILPNNFHGRNVTDDMSFLDKEKMMIHLLTSTTSNYLPNLQASIFSSFWLGALEFANTDFPLFLLTALLSKSTLISSKGSY